MPNKQIFAQSKGTVLLINGLGTSGIFWPEEILNPLLANGYQVIVSDHRGLGESDWLDETHRYNLDNMVQDNLAVLNELNIERAHVIGLSMGGMIGQQMALTHAHRVQSLTSVMSSGFLNDPDLPSESSFKYNAIKYLLRFGLVESEENTVKMLVAIYNILKGEKDIDIRYVSTATLYELRHRQGFNHKVADQHAKAIQRSGSRLQMLPELKVATLVVHGDADPILNIGHAQKYASQIVDAQSFWVKGMGHGLAPEYTRMWMAKAITFIGKENAY